MILLMEEHVTKDEKKELRRREAEEKLKKEQQKQNLKKIGLWLGIALLVVAGIWLLTQSPNTSDKGTITAPPISGKDMTTGNKDAKVTMIEYGDFQCPACGAYFPIVHQILKDFNGKIYFAYRYFPLTTVHRNAFVGAQAAQAANLQGKFWEMHDLLYGNQNKWSGLDNPLDTFVSYAQKLGLNLDKFKSDYNAQSTKDFINSEENTGTNIGVNSTPTFFVNNHQIQNPQSYDEFKLLIQNKLNGK